MLSPRPDLWAYDAQGRIEMTRRSLCLLCEVRDEQLGPDPVLHVPDEWADHARAIKARVAELLDTTKLEDVLTWLDAANPPWSTR